MMVEKLEAIETKVPFKVKVMVFLLSLLDSYKFVVTSLEFYESTKLTWEVVTTKLLIEKLMGKERGDAPSTSDVALIHTSQNNVGFRKTIRDKSQDVCNYCKMKGHWVKDYTKRKKNEKSKKPKKKIDEKKGEHGNSVIDHNETFVITTLSMSSDESWYVDFGASMHLFHIRDWFYDFEKISPIKIYMGDNSTQEIVGKGKIKINMIVRVNNISATFSDIIYVLGLAKNLFFVSKAMFQGYSVEFGDDFCEIKNNQKNIVAHGVKKNQLWELS